MEYFTGNRARIFNVFRNLHWDRGEGVPTITCNSLFGNPPATRLPLPTDTRTPDSANAAPEQSGVRGTGSPTTTTRSAQDWRQPPAGFPAIRTPGISGRLPSLNRLPLPHGPQDGSRRESQGRVLLAGLEPVT